MITLVDQMTSGEAAELLGVSVRQVRRHAESGALESTGRVGGALLIDANSVHRLSERGTQPGRPWSEQTAWAAIDLLQNGRTSRLDAARRSRLRRRLHHLDAEEFVRMSRRRADVKRFRASNSFLQMLRAHVALTGMSAVAEDLETAAAFDLASGNADVVDGYATRAQASRLIDEFLLVGDIHGNVTLRTTEREYADASLVDKVTVGLDLAESLDTRARSAGLRILRESLPRA